MPARTLPGMTHIIYPFDLIPVWERTWLGKRVVSGGTVRFRVESDRPVIVYVVDPSGLAEFESHVPFASYYTAKNVTHSANYIRLPTNSVGYLLVVNDQQQPAAVFYEANEEGQCR